jgi:integrase/recombinase XerD
MKTLRDLLEEYLSHRRGLNYSPRSLEEYGYDCGGFLRHIEERFGVMSVPELRKQHLLSYQKSLSGRKNRKGMPILVRSVNGNLSSVRNFLLHLADSGHLLRSMPETLVPLKEPSFLPIGAPAHGEIRRMFSKVDISTPEGYRDRTILEVLYSTGIRASELAGLDVDKADLRNATLIVFGKGRKERMVPLGKTALRFLETYIKAVRPFLMKGGETSALFLNSSGTRLQRYTLGIMVRKHCGDANTGIPVSPHSFRRSCTTELIRSNANLYHVKELLGHETLSTVKHYAKLTILDLKKTHEKCHPRERDG